MSTYANYEDISLTYDDQRNADGADVIAGLIQLKQNLKDVHILDAGCGSGNYSKALLEFGVGSISLMDGSKGMLKNAEQKLLEANMMTSVKNVKHAYLPNIPFDDKSFDAVMINQVLHHLEEKVGISKTIKEVARVLKPGGILIITTSTPKQGAFWFTNLMPEVLRRYQSNLPSLQQLEDVLLENGLTTHTRLAYLGDGMYSDYCNIKGPLNKSWRNLDSFWAFATENELNECIRWVKEMKQLKTLKQFYKDYDKIDYLGAFTIIMATLKKESREI